MHTRWERNVIEWGADFNLLLCRWNVANRTAESRHRGQWQRLLFIPALSSVTQTSCWQGISIWKSLKSASESTFKTEPITQTPTCCVLRLGVEITTSSVDPESSLTSTASQHTQRHPHVHRHPHIHRHPHVHNYPNMYSHPTHTQPPHPYTATPSIHRHPHIHSHLYIHSHPHIHNHPYIHRHPHVHNYPNMDSHPTHTQPPSLVDANIDTSSQAPSAVASTSSSSKLNLPLPVCFLEGAKVTF